MREWVFLKWGTEIILEGAELREFLKGGIGGTGDFMGVSGF